jgi:hypothetical protein
MTGGCEMGDNGESKGNGAFREKIVLLLLTALLTGLLVPFINGTIAAQRARSDQREAAKLARQASVIRSQEEFLERLEKTVFEFHTRAAAVPWYKTQQPDPEKFNAAAEAYDAASWRFMSDMHALMSKGRRLTSDEAFRALQQHQQNWYEIDLAIVQLMRKDATEDEWRKMLGQVNAQALNGQALLRLLAADYKLVPEPLR